MQLLAALIMHPAQLALHRPAAQAASVAAFLAAVVAAADAAAGRISHSGWQKDFHCAIITASYARY